MTRRQMQPAVTGPVIDQAEKRQKLRPGAVALVHRVGVMAVVIAQALEEARDRGVAHLDMWQADQVLVEVLTYVDRTTGPHGESITLDERRADLVARYGIDGSPVRWFDETVHVAQAGAAHCAPRRALSA